MERRQAKVQGLQMEEIDQDIIYHSLKVVTNLVINYWYSQPSLWNLLVIKGNRRQIWHNLISFDLEEITCRGSHILLAFKWHTELSNMIRCIKKKNWCERLGLCTDNAYTTLCGLCYTSEPKYEWKMVEHVFGLCNTLWPQFNWLQMKLHSLSIESKWFIDN